MTRAWWTLRHKDAMTLLRPGSAYALRVSAANAVGAGPAAGGTSPAR